MKLFGKADPASKSIVREQYDSVYERKSAAADANLSMSLHKLYLNYGEYDTAARNGTEKLGIAWDVLDPANALNQPILDYGCGSAKAATVLAQEGAVVIGFDISIASIQLGIRRAKANCVEDKVSLLVASGDKLPFPDAAFSRIFGYEVLYYMNGKVDFGPEILRVLKPGGKAVFCEALGDNPAINAMRAVLRHAKPTINRTGGTPLKSIDIESAFEAASHVEIRRMNILGMAKRVITNRNTVSAAVLSWLKRADAILLQYPACQSLCGEAAIIVTK